MKTLGQVAYEARNDNLVGVDQYGLIPQSGRDKWEEVASAVASAVASEAVERFKRSLADPESSLGKIAYLSQSPSAACRRSGNRR